MAVPKSEFHAGGVEFCLTHVVPTRFLESWRTIKSPLRNLSLLRIWPIDLGGNEKIYPSSSKFMGFSRGMAVALRLNA